jgi:lipopolysaccharide heptosyltransferase II
MDGASWGSARRVLCVRLDTIGDVLMTTPAIRACKGDGRHVTLLTSRAGAEIARLVPEIDDVIAFDAPWMKNAPALDGSATVRAMADDLRERHFDAAAIFTVHSQSPLPAAMLCWLAEIPLRLAHCRENPYQLLTEWARETESGVPSRHEVRRQLDLVAHAGYATADERLSLRAGDMAYVAAGSRLAARGVDIARPWVVLHPGATAPSRRYPAESYARVASMLARDGVHVVVTGTDDERAIVDAVAGDTPGVHGFAGEFSVEEMAALLSMAALLIANNTGPIHMAAAFGTPVVDVYAATNPQHTPWMTPARVLTHDVPCANCMSSVCPEGHHDCLRKITPLEVVQAARELLCERVERERNETVTRAHA